MVKNLHLTSITAVAKDSFKSKPHHRFYEKDHSDWLRDEPFHFPDFL